MIFLLMSLTRLGSRSGVCVPSGGCVRIMIKADVTLCHVGAQLLEDNTGSPLVYPLWSPATMKEEVQLARE